jgi:hypothetical protein
MALIAILKLWATRTFKTSLQIIVIIIIILIALITVIIIISIVVLSE